MKYTRELSVKYDVDVFVAGAGPAGITAAVAASRMGKTVFLADSQGSFGGAATAGFVPCFAPFGDGVNILASGIGYEVRQKVSKDVPLDAYWTPIKVEELKRTYDELIKDSKIKYSLFTTLCDAVSSGGEIDYVVLSAKSGLFAVKAKIYIDCTGDGDLCAYAGAEFELGDENGEVMPATLCSIWANIDYSKRRGADSRALEKAFEDKVFTNEDRHLPGMQTVDRANGIGGGNISHAFNVDPLDECSLTNGAITSRKILPEYEKYYKEYLDGFDNLTLVASAPMLGVRESRRIVCDYMLSVDDFVKQSVFDDEIGRYCYPVDIHIMNTNKEEFERFNKEYTKTLRYGKGESYGIPYRSLTPKGFKNLLVAGRCLGSDRQMQASIRVMPGCYITGQAAGAAAALACDFSDTRAFDVRMLQKALLKLGACLPSFKD